MDNFYSISELKKLGIKSLGNNVLISKKASIYSPDKLVIGNDVRIDDFCILSGNIKIGNNVHISAYTALYGKYGIEIGDYCGCSPRCTILSGSDDFSGDYMISPMVPEKYTNVIGSKIMIKRFCQVGSNSIVMPGVTFEEGSVCGCFSFVKSNLKAWTINAGIPTNKIKDRNKNIIELEKEYRNEM